MKQKDKKNQQKIVDFFCKIVLTKVETCGIISRSQGRSGCGAAGSALPWGGRGRKFKSCHSDQKGDSSESPFFFVFLRLSLVFSLFVFSFLFRETFKNRGFWADFSDCYLKLLPKFFAVPFRTPNCYSKSFTTIE